MAQRSREDWQKLIEEQAHSNQTAIEFCKERGINDKYFSSIKYKLKNQGSSVSAFAKVKKTVPVETSSGIVVTFHAVSITLPVTTDAQWVAKLVRSLNS